MIPTKKRVREILPKATNAGPPEPPVEPPPKRHNTFVACQKCRQRKIKCDGVRPRCSACTKKGYECVFTMDGYLHPRQADKEQLNNYRITLESFQDASLEEIWGMVARIRQSSNIDDSAKAIADAQLLLRGPSSSGASATKSDSMGAKTSHSSIGFSRKQLNAPHEDPNFIIGKYFQSSQGQFVDKNVVFHIDGRSLPLSKWTNVSTDNELMNHLLTMFFTWDNIAERSLYRVILEDDIIRLNPEMANDQPGSFCTQFLINALLAASCLYELDPRTFQTPGNSKSRGRHWAEAADLSLKDYDARKPSLPLLQGLYCLFVYEGNIGSGAKAMDYFFKCKDIYNALNDNLSSMQSHHGAREERVQREKEAISWCMWGFYCCEWRTTQALCRRKMTQKPKIPKEWRNTKFSLSQPGGFGEWWCAYPNATKMQPSLQVEVREADVALSEIAEDMMTLIYPPEGEENVHHLVNPRRALEIYDALVEWKLSLPDPLRFEMAVIPSTILLHITLELMFTELLRPFATMSKEQFGKFDPRQRCLSHVHKMITNVWHFRKSAQIHHEYWLVHVIGTSAYLIFRDDENEAGRADVLCQGCHCLVEMKTSLPLAEDVLSGIRAVFEFYKLKVPNYLQNYLRGVRHRKDGLMHFGVLPLMPKLAHDGAPRPAKKDLLLADLLLEFDSIQLD